MKQEIDRNQGEENEEGRDHTIASAGRIVFRLRSRRSLYRRESEPTVYLESGAVFTSI